MQLRDRIGEAPTRIFPDATLLNHIPELLGVLLGAAFEEEDPTRSEFVVGELRDLGNLRRSQGYGIQEVIAEFGLLRNILLDELQVFAGRWPEPIPPKSALEAAIKLDSAYQVVLDTTTRVFENEALASRKDRSQLLSAFGKSVTHELRNRLGAAIINLRLVSELPDDATDRRGPLLLELAKCLRRVESVVADVYSVAIAQRNHARVEGTVRLLNELVSEAVEDVSDLAYDRSVEVHVRGEIPAVYVDGTRVQLILMNLLTNGIKHHDRSKRNRWVRVEAERAEDSGKRAVRVRVADNGIGIPPEDQPYVFDETVRLPGGDEEGEGIGLALVQAAAKQLHSEVELDSTPGQGSTFSFVAPVPSEELPP